MVKLEAGIKAQAFEHAAEQGAGRAVAGDTDEGAARMRIRIGLVATAQLRQEYEAVASGRDLCRFRDQAVITETAGLLAKPFDRAARGGKPAHQRVARHA